MKFHIQSILFSLFSLVTLSSCTSYNCSIKPTVVCKLPAYTLSNGLVKADIIPASNGRLADLTYLPSSSNVMIPFEEKRYYPNPLLPEVIENNNSGLKEWFWGLKNFNTSSMEVKAIKKTANSVAVKLSAANYQGSPFGLTRKITLSKNSCSFDIKTTVTNNIKRQLKFALWLNTIPDHGPKQKDTLILPAKGGVKRIKGRSMKYFKTNTLLKLKPKEEIFVAPSRPWVARCSPDRNLILAYLIPPHQIMPDGFYYSWYGNVSGKNSNTLEAVFNSTTLKPGDTESWNYQLVIFPGLSDLSDIIGDRAIHCQIDNNLLKINIATCRQKSQSSLEVKLVSNSSTVSVGSHSIAKQTPGEVIRITYKLPIDIPKGQYNIQLAFTNGPPTSLIEPKYSKK